MATGCRGLQHWWAEDLWLCLVPKSLCPTPGSLKQWNWDLAHSWEEYSTRRWPSGPDACLNGWMMDGQVGRRMREWVGEWIHRWLGGWLMVRLTIALMAYSEKGRRCSPRGKFPQTCWAASHHHECKFLLYRVRDFRFIGGGSRGGQSLASLTKTLKTGCPGPDSGPSVQSGLGAERGVEQPWAVWLFLTSALLACVPRAFIPVITLGHTSHHRHQEKPQVSEQLVKQEREKHRLTESG